MSTSPAGITLILGLLDSIDRRLDGKYVSSWLTAQEAAAYLHCSPRQIESLTSKGLLPYGRQDPTKSKSPRLYHRKHLDAYLVTGRNPSKPRLSPVERRLVEELF